MASFSFFSEKKALVQSWYSGHPWRLVVNFFFHAIHFLCVVLMKTANASDERDDCISKNKMTTLDVEDFYYRPVPCYPHIHIYRENPAAFFFSSQFVHLLAEYLIDGGGVVCTADSSQLPVHPSRNSKCSNTGCSGKNCVFSQFTATPPSPTSL